VGEQCISGRKGVVTAFTFVTNFGGGGDEIDVDVILTGFVSLLVIGVEVLISVITVLIIYCPVIFLVLFCYRSVVSSLGLSIDAITISVGRQLIPVLSETGPAWL
jgi:hypothetical protein